MLFENWYYFLLRAIPETVALLALGTALLREQNSLKQLTVLGIIISLITFLIQMLPIEYGIHMPLSIIVFILAMKAVLKLSVLKSTAAVLFSFFVLIVVEMLTVFFMINVIGYPEVTIMHGPDPVKLLFSLPALAVIIILAAGAQAWLRCRAGRAG